MVPSQIPACHCLVYKFRVEFLFIVVVFFTEWYANKSFCSGICRQFQLFLSFAASTARVVLY